ncbi:hypothetical protein [Kaistella antarctica]|uniref:Uncharacterized protein n=1 Tax=Kaistella antarctica TaxID=266748 RepID=A0A3S4UZ60_9FLAO|nr:hypothetical protein [Kaistella antarctica]KEY17961.1 hypothetical protein HY04_05380 [Kaistella antarctica]SEV81651.1 hypothetical protein SAMN05421765_0276 [Kaistella antarctica]VEI00392.1 Uncharacterised protein [Kaistella antarctica]
MLSDVKNLFSLSFKITGLKEEQGFLTVLADYQPNFVSENLSEYLCDKYLTSNLNSLQNLLITISKFGFQSYVNWKLSFPNKPNVQIFINNSINNNLALYENEIELCLLKILIFLKENFSPISENKQKILLPFYTETALNKRFVYLNHEFKVRWYESYSKRLEKILVLKYLLYSCIGHIEIDLEHEYSSGNSHSILTNHIAIQNNRILQVLKGLRNDGTLTYHTFLIHLIQKFSISNAEFETVKALDIEKQYTKNYAENLVSFREVDCERVINVLSPYFTQKEQTVLKEIINSKSVNFESKLVFQQKSIVLTYFLKMLYEENILVANSKQSLSTWIMKNFQYLLNGRPIDFKENTIQRTLNRDSKAPKLILSIN